MSDLCDAIDAVLGDVKLVFWVNLSEGDTYVAGTKADGSIGLNEVLSIEPESNPATLDVEVLDYNQQTVGIHPSKVQHCSRSYRLADSLT